MTISTEIRVAGPYTGTGAVTEYPFEFKVFTSADVLVVQTDTDGVESTLEETTDYGVTLNPDQDDDPGGTVTLNSALVLNYLLTITSQVADTQEVELTNNGGFYPRVINDALDKLVILIQQVKNLTTRSLKFPLSDGEALNTELPTAAVRANKVLAFDTNGEAAVSNMTLAQLEAPSSAAADAQAARVAAEAAQAATEAVAAAYTDARPVDRFNGTGAQTAFTLSSAPGSENNTWVFISGVYQQKDTYSVSGTTLTFSVAPPSGTGNVEVVYGTILPIGTPSDSTVTGAKLVAGGMTSAQLAAALTDETGSGSVAFSASPAFTGTANFENVGLSGLMNLSAGTAGQVKFPAAMNASADANTLDDYEEGTFTPTITFGGGSTGITYSLQAGEYTKIGDRVFFSATVHLTSKGSSTGQALINGLPFTSSNAGSANTACAVRGDVFAAGVNALMAQITNGATTVLILSFAAGGSSGLTDTSYNNTTQIRISGHYRT